MTTVTIEDELKRNLEQYRTTEHDNISDVIQSIINVTPTPDDILANGCEECGRGPTSREPVDYTGGVVRVWTTYPPERDSGEDPPITSFNYYCSVDCLQATEERTKKQMPTHPDVVAIGGDEQFRAVVKGATFRIDGHQMSVGMDIPGAFSGTSDVADREYDYVGEPVFIGEQGDWVRSGEVKEVVHEEGHTTLILNQFLENPDEYRPEESPDEMQATF